MEVDLQAGYPHRPDPVLDGTHWEFSTSPSAWASASLVTLLQAPDILSPVLTYRSLVSSHSGDTEAQRAEATCSGVSVRVRYKFRSVGHQSPGTGDHFQKKTMGAVWQMPRGSL
jgi:hypothetical protein